jgi:tetraacyldisaccharide 4'-kinase
MAWEQVWYGDRAADKVVRYGLWPLSLLYAAGWTAYRALYDLGLKRAAHPYRPILCVGNLTVGGSGKTPTVLFLCDELRALGVDVVVSCSGYGSPASESARRAPAGSLSAEEWGDEAAVLRELRPEVGLIVGRRRVRAAEIMAEAGMRRTVLLMDDGFQHLPLAKDAALLLDPASPNTFCLPAGPYREPRRNLARADVVVGPRGRYRIQPEICGFTRLDGSESVTHLEWPASALCAIGRPEQFFAALRNHGVLVIETRTRPDHDTLSEPNLFTGLLGPIVVTAKDAVKLRLRPDVSDAHIWVAEHRITIEPLDEFRAWLRSKVAEWFPEGALD